jgi:membrane protein implicated in regulation of membrane protease activity
LSDPNSNPSFIEDAIKYYMSLDHSSQIAVAGAIMAVSAAIIAVLSVLVAFVYTRRQRRLSSTQIEQINEARNKKK